MLKLLRKCWQEDDIKRQHLSLNMTGGFTLKFLAKSNTQFCGIKVNCSYWAWEMWTCWEESVAGQFFREVTSKYCTVSNLCNGKPILWTLCLFTFGRIITISLWTLIMYHTFINKSQSHNARKDFYFFYQINKMN